MLAGTRRRVVLLLRMLGGGVVFGAVLGGASGFEYRDAPLVGAIVGALAGATTGALLVGTIVGSEIFLPSTRIGHALERTPFLVTFATKLLVYGAVIVFVVGSRLSSHLVGAVAALLPVPELATVMSAQIAAPRAPRLERAFLLLGFAIFMVQMSRLVGERTLRDVVLGRYHRSRTEDRFFLFVDIVGSTPLAMPAKSQAAGASMVDSVPVF
jgi:adenylate cyclase